MIVAPVNLVAIIHVPTLVSLVRVDRMQLVPSLIIVHNVHVSMEWLQAQRLRSVVFAHQHHIVPKIVDVQMDGPASKNTVAQFVLPI